MDPEGVDRRMGDGADGDDGNKSERKEETGLPPTGQKRPRRGFAEVPVSLPAECEGKSGIPDWTQMHLSYPLKTLSICRN